MLLHDAVFASLRIWREWTEPPIKTARTTEALSARESHGT